MIKRVNISLSEAGRRVFAAAPRLVGITLMVMRLFGKFFAVILGLCGARLSPLLGMSLGCGLFCCVIGSILGLKCEIGEQ